LHASDSIVTGHVALLPSPAACASACPDRTSCCIDPTRPRHTPPGSHTAVLNDSPMNSLSLICVVP
jgi:hypothetical protein